MKKYFYPKSSERFKEAEQRHIPMFKTLSENKDKSLDIIVDPDIIEGKVTMMLNEIILIAEHNKERIECLLFSIKFWFSRIKGSELYFQEGEWQSDKEIQRWLRKNGESLPFTLFFLSDWEARFFSVIGDLIADKKVSIGKRDEMHVIFSVEHDGQNIIDQRTGQACQLFMHYCNETGFEPKQAIEAVLAEFQTCFGYDKVKEQFDKDIKDGVEFLVKPRNNPPSTE